MFWVRGLLQCLESGFMTHFFLECIGWDLWLSVALIPARVAPLTTDHEPSGSLCLSTKMLRFSGFCICIFGRT